MTPLDLTLGLWVPYTPMDEFYIIVLAPPAEFGFSFAASHTAELRTVVGQYLPGFDPPEFERGTQQIDGLMR